MRIEVVVVLDAISLRVTRRALHAGLSSQNPHQSGLGDMKHCKRCTGAVDGDDDTL